VRLELAQPFVALVPFLADSFSSIICDSNRGREGFGTSVAVGSGPWKLESWTKGDRIVLDRHDAVAISASSTPTRAHP
jgi:peptide/nickel transport system substrate-binding protein